MALISRYGIPLPGTASVQQMKNSEEHQRFAVLGKNFSLHYGSNAPVPVEERREVLVRLDLAPINRWVCSYDSQATCGRKVLIERADQWIQLLIKAGGSSHLLDRRVSPDMLDFGEWNVLASDVTVQKWLIANVTALNDYVVH